MNSTAPLLIVANLPDDFSLDDLHFDDQMETQPSINEAKYKGLGAKEVVLDGMAFVLDHENTGAMQKRFADQDFHTVFCEKPEKSASCISIALDENIANAKHIGTINRALLMLGKVIGEKINATSIIWTPGETNVGFDYFCEAADLYVNSGAFPALVQLSFASDEQGRIKTRGLDYFADQEIELKASAGYAENEAIKRLVRIAHDIATNGKIDTRIESDGLVAGERIYFEPGSDLKTVFVEIKQDQPQQLH